MLKLRSIFEVVFVGVVVLGCANSPKKVIMSQGPGAEYRRVQQLADHAQRLGTLELKKGNLEGAITKFTESLVLLENTLLRLTLASLYKEIGDNKSALTHMDRVFSNESSSGSYMSDPVTLNEYASLCDMQGRKKDAQRLYLQILAGYHPPQNQYFPAIDTNISEPGLVQASANLIASNRLMSYGENQKALTLCIEATKLKPNFAQARLMLGYALESVGRRDEARQEYKKAYNMGNPKIRKIATESMSLQ